MRLPAPSLRRTGLVDHMTRSALPWVRGVWHGFSWFFQGFSWFFMVLHGFFHPFRVVRGLLAPNLFHFGSGAVGQRLLGHVSGTSGMLRWGMAA